MESKQTFLGRLADLFDEEETTPADIDREVVSAVAALKNSGERRVEGEDILIRGWGRAGDMVYVLRLRPFRDFMGERAARMAPVLVENCARVFRQRIPEGQGCGCVKGELFFMRFADADETAGFRKAAQIVNEIGTRMLGENFEKIPVPSLVTATDIRDIVNARGHLDTAQAESMVRKGGRPVAMAEPDDDAAEWIKLAWRNRQAHMAATEAEWRTMRVRRPGDPDWAERRGGRRRRQVPPAAGMERRSGRRRRAADRQTERAW